MNSNRVKILNFILLRSQLLVENASRKFSNKKCIGIRKLNFLLLGNCLKINSFNNV